MDYEKPFEAREEDIIDKLKLESEFKNKYKAAMESQIDLMNSQLSLSKQQKLEYEKRDAEYHRQISDLTTQSKKQDVSLAQLQQKYDLLSKSKFGRLQLSHWDRTTRIRYKLASFKQKLRNSAKSSSLITAIVRRIRGGSNNTASLSSMKEIKKLKTVDPEQPFDTGFFEKIQDKVDYLPNSNAGRFYEKNDLKIGILTDEFAYYTYRDVADIIVLTPDEWQSQIEGIDMLLIITGWFGVYRDWVGFAVEYSPKRQIIYNIIEECRKRDILTVFYSKEDPPNYQYYINIAKKCEYIFTTAEEVIPHYKRDCNTENVFSLCFAINPLFHNPVGMRKFEKIQEVIFAGSWYDKYPERAKNMFMVFDGVLKSKKTLRIIDRNFELNDPEFRFPNRYSQYISPKISHDTLQKVHRLFDWAINFNTVTESATMFATRVYELEASGNLLISNYSVGVNALLPIVYTVQDSDEVARIIDSMTEDELYERQITGIRHAMTGETCYDRFNKILTNTGFPVKENNRCVAVVFDEDECDEQVKAMFINQTYPHKELISATDLKTRIEQFDMLAFFSKSAEYGDFYLEDMINAFKFTDCDYVTKNAYKVGDKLVTGEEHDFTSMMESKYRTVFWASAFDADELLNMKDGTIREGGYSSDRFNYNLIYEPKVHPVRIYKLSVIIPVYNNGLHLYGKAFASLIRSSIFTDMEILLIDDGSTDKSTLSYIRHLQNKYENVKTYFFEEGGSGSASRPRNKGVELATADYISFLDPDDESVNDGYTFLYNNAVENNCDITIGNVTILREKPEYINYYYYFKNVHGSDFISGATNDFIKRIGFIPMRIQAMVIRKNIITDNTMEQIVGAIGEDSLFSMQLFHNAKSIRAYDVNVHIYYAMISGSAVNDVSHNFFLKNMLSLHAQKVWLKETNLLEAYMNTRFNNYFRDWILKKLSTVGTDNICDCVKTVYEMFVLYKENYNEKDFLINTFVGHAESNDFQAAFTCLTKHFSEES